MIKIPLAKVGLLSSSGYFFVILHVYASSLIMLILFLLLLFLKAASVESISLKLNFGDDSIANEACCVNGGAGTGSNMNCCNLRSAVAYCAQQTPPINTLEECTVQLMPWTATAINSSLGQLELGGA